MNYMFRKIVVAIALLLSGVASFSQNPNFHIYLCFGQSNMGGASRAEAQDSVVDPRFKMMSAMDCKDKGRVKGNWYTATPPICDCKAGISPADYFGRTLVENMPKNTFYNALILYSPLFFHSSISNTILLIHYMMNSSLKYYRLYYHH